MKTKADIKIFSDWWFKVHLLCKILFYMLFEHKCVLAVCVYNNPIMIKNTFFLIPINHKQCLTTSRSQNRSNVMSHLQAPPTTVEEQCHISRFISKMFNFTDIAYCVFVTYSMCVFNINLCVFDSLKAIRHERELSLVLTSHVTAEFFACTSDVCAQKTVSEV